MKVAAHDMRDLGAGAHAVAERQVAHVRAQQTPHLALRIGGNHGVEDRHVRDYENPRDCGVSSQCGQPAVEAPLQIARHGAIAPRPIHIVGVVVDQSLQLRVCAHRDREMTGVR